MATRQGKNESSEMQEVRQIMVAFTAGDSYALGNIWRLTTKRTDFYLEPVGVPGGLHLSAHGPNRRFPDRHRFHVKVAEDAVEKATRRSHFMYHKVGPRGHEFDGQAIAPGAFLVARIRWVWDLQREEFRQAALNRGPLPEIGAGQSGRKLSSILEPEAAADLDLVVSYEEPYWPHERGSLEHNARLGPLRNDAGMWLTATSYRRSLLKHPSPDGLTLPGPTADEQPNRIMSGGPGDDKSADIYWFVESITSRELIEANQDSSD
ncbi:hypothetical protein ABZS29_29290 [Kribbella sp. NPDC005582]|uniref:hypothetical protein n=1 Tax=Kribbella sp. NPDC005582 TaxID=3156893 RepID=UPI0033A2EEB8